MEKKLVQKTSAFMLFCAMLSSMIFVLSPDFPSLLDYLTLTQYLAFSTFTDFLFPICTLLGALFCLIVKRRLIRKVIIWLMYIPAIIYIITYLDEYGIDLGIGYFLYLIFVSIALFITSREAVTDEEKSKDAKVGEGFRKFIKKYKALLIMVLIVLVVLIIDALSWYFF